MNKDIIRQISVVVALIITIAVNVLSNAIPFNGLTAPEIADSFDVYFVPAGYVFSIWSLIYLGLIAYAVFQLASSATGKSQTASNRLVVCLELCSKQHLAVLMALRLLCPVRCRHAYLINFPDRHLSSGWV